MVCKEDVVCWFKELESYKRIDTMCTLLNTCLPFEIRFLGTCLEELGGRDSIQLRSIELRVNNSSELASELASCQLGEPSDIKVRRKMALYLAMIRACNRPCVIELFNTLSAWGNHDFIKTAEGDPLQELLLVYTMAANHPVFSIDQRLKCGEIYNKIVGMGNESTTQIQTELLEKQSEKTFTQFKTSGTDISTQQTAGSTVFAVPKPLPLSSISVSIAPTLAEQSLSLNVMSQLGFEPSTASQNVRDTANTSPNQITPDGTMPGFQHAVNIAHISKNPSSSSSGPYAIRTNASHPRYQAHLSDQSESPSQPSSPIESRSSSPRVKLQSSRHSYKHESRSSSLEAAPIMQPLPSVQQHPQYIDAADKSDLGNAKVSIDEAAMSQLQSIYYTRNGYIRQNRPRHMNKPNIHPAQSQMVQQPIQQMYTVATNPNGLAHSLHNLNLVDTHEGAVLNTESDSVSSGESVDDTPPDTPHTHAGGNKTSSNKKYNKLRELPMLSRQKVGNPQLMYSQPPPQVTSPHGVPNTTQQGENMIMSSTASPQQQQQSNMNINVSNLSGSNNNLVTSTVLIANKATGNVTTQSIAGFGIAGNPPVLFQQYAHPPPHIQQGIHIQQSQNNATYHYHTQQLPLNNRASILPTSNTTTPGPQSAPYRLQYHVQPNGEVIYPYPTTIAYMQPTAIMTRPSTHQSHPSVGQVIPQPTALAISAKHSTSLAAYPTSSDPKVLSCFNCGSHSHTGRDCQEASIEDVTRGTIYKLDYNTSSIVDASKTDLDNGLDASTLPPVSNK